MKDQNKEIRAIIEKNLPQQVGEVLKQRLEQAEKDSNNVERLKSINENACSEIKELQGEIKKYIQFDDRNRDIDKREKELSENEQAFKCNTLQVKLDEANKRANIVTEFTHGLVRNTIFKKNIFESADQPQVQDQYGSNQYVPPITSTRNEETKAE